MKSKDRSPSDRPLETSDFEELLEFRDGLRRFMRWSDDCAKSAGITPSQHQLLLAIRGHRGPSSVSDIASHLLLRHHSTVELVDRAEVAGLVERVGDDEDHRVVRVRLSAEGERKLQALSTAHLEELSRIGSRLAGLWRRLPAGEE
jgi:DNA-binding MarR family transcriptional regulator